MEEATSWSASLPIAISWASPTSMICLCPVAGLVAQDESSASDARMAAAREGMGCLMASFLSQYRAGTARRQGAGRECLDGRQQREAVAVGLVEELVQGRAHVPAAVHDLTCPVEVLALASEVPARGRAGGQAAQVADLVRDLDDL